MKKLLLTRILPFFLSLTLTIACSSPNANLSSTAPGQPSNSSSGMTDIPIGIALAQTSNVALLGQEQIIGAKVAEKLFNEKGGVNSIPIKLVLQDTAGDEQGAINAFNTLITQNQVVGIIGPSLSQQAFAADPIADRMGVPVLGPSNTAKNIPQIGQYISRVSAPIAVVAPYAVQEALKIKPDLKKVAIFYAQNDAFSKSETETFQETVKSLGLEITTVQKFQTTDTDFQSQATNGINTKPDLIIISGLASDGGNLVKQLRQLGYTGLIIGGNGLNSSNIFPVCQKFCDGVIIAQAYSPELKTPMNQEFRKAYEAQQKQVPPQLSAQSFTGVQVFVEALKAVDRDTKLNTLSLAQLRTKLNEKLLSLSYDTPLGKISFDPEGEIKQSDFYVAQINMEADGKTGQFSYLN